MSGFWLWVVFCACTSVALLAPLFDDLSMCPDRTTARLLLTWPLWFWVAPVIVAGFIVAWLGAAIFLASVFVWGIIRDAIEAADIHLPQIRRTKVITRTAGALSHPDADGGELTLRYKKEDRHEC